jgi:excisionase family DNA binding protein
VTEYLKIPEVARRLDVSEKTVRRYIKSGELPSVFIGGAYRVSEEDLETFLDNARVTPGSGYPKGPASPSREPSFNDVIEERRLNRFADAIASAADKWADDVLDVEIDDSSADGLVQAILSLWGNLASGITREEWRALTSQEQDELETVMNKLATASMNGYSRLRASGHFDAQQEELLEQRREEIREWTRKISA